MTEIDHGVGDGHVAFVLRQLADERAHEQSQYVAAGPRSIAHPARKKERGNQSGLQGKTPEWPPNGHCRRDPKQPRPRDLWQPKNVGQFGNVGGGGVIGRMCVIKTNSIYIECSVFKIDIHFIRIEAKKLRGK